MKYKKIPLYLADEILAKEPGLSMVDQQQSKEEKKLASSERKELKELRERYPITISIRFKEPWWSIPEDT